MTGLESVPALLRGEAAGFQDARYAEAGLCEPGCSPGCTPEGVQGRDRVLFTAEGGTATLRAGSIRTRGAVSPAQVEALQSIPPVPAPGAPNVRSLERLGYSEP